VGDEPPPEVNWGIDGLGLGYSLLYVECQREVLVRVGAHGPLGVYSRLSLFLTWIVSALASDFFWMPRGWSSAARARFLRAAAAAASHVLPRPATRTRAWRWIDRMLAALAKPPLRIPTLGAPAFLGARGAAMIKGVVRYACQGMKDTGSAAYVVAELRPRAWVQRSWASAINGPRVIKEMELTDIRGSTPEVLAAAARMRAECGSWPLPRWPRHRDILRRADIEWHAWARAVRLPPRARWRGAAELQRRLREVVVPDPPSEWAAAERGLESARQRCRSGETIMLGDERDRGKVWTVKAEEMALGFLQALLSDGAWVHQPNLRPQDVLMMQVARGMYAFPGWLRGRLGEQVEPPRAFPLVKSKCYRDSGEKVCCKAGHLCLRRFIDASQAP